MTATTRRKTRTVNPVRCDCHATGRIVYPCEMIPAGVPVRVTINEQDYLLSAHGEQPEAGYRFVKLDGDGAVYDVDVSEGYAACDCADATYQERACKHALATIQLRQQGVI